MNEKWLFFFFFLSGSSIKSIKEKEKTRPVCLLVYFQGWKQSALAILRPYLQFVLPTQLTEVPEAGKA